MVGRGTSDMKSGVAALVVAVADHVRGRHACRGVQVVLTSGEETGCEGALAIPSSALGQGGPLVVAEPTANRLVPAHKGAHWMRLTAQGKAAHGSAPELGDNAAVRLARAAVALHDFDGWPTQDGFGWVTANVGVLRGGVQPNVVPDAAELLLDVRTVPSASGDAVRDLVRTLAGEGVQVDDHVVLPPVDTSLDDGFLALVGEALAATGLDGAPAEPARFFTDASALSRCFRGRGTRPDGDPRPRGAGPVPRRRRVVLAGEGRPGGGGVRRPAAPVVRLSRPRGGNETAARKPSEGATQRRWASHRGRDHATAGAVRGVRGGGLGSLVLRAVALLPAPVGGPSQQRTDWRRCILEETHARLPQERRRVTRALSTALAVTLTTGSAPSVRCPRPPPSWTPWTVRPLGPR